MIGAILHLACRPLAPTMAACLPSPQFGRTVRALQARAGYSQESFAHAIGVHRTYMGTVERGTSNPTLAIITWIVEGLRMSVTALFEAVKGGR